VDLERAAGAWLALHHTHLMWKIDRVPCSTPALRRVRPLIEAVRKWPLPSLVRDA